MKNCLLTALLFITNLALCQKVDTLNLMVKTYGPCTNSDEINKSEYVPHPKMFTFNIKNGRDSFLYQAPEGMTAKFYKFSHLTTADPAIRTKKDNVHMLLLETKYKLGKALVSFDNNQNYSFLDEEIDTIAYDSFYCASLSFGVLRRDFRYLVNRRYEGPDGHDKVKHQKLNHFLARHLVGDSLLQAVITPTGFNTVIKLSYTQNGQRQVGRYLLDEPFEFNGRTMRFSNFNPKEGTIALSTLSDHTVKYGYKPGYKINFEGLKAIPNNGVNFSSDYNLLYFWGEWCGPCKAFMDKTLELHKIAKTSKQLSMSFYPLVLDDRSLEQTLDYVKIKGLPEQYFQYLDSERPKKCEDFIPFQKACTLKQLLQVEGYPSYILFDNEGAILYHGNNRDGKLKELLEELDIG